MPVWHRPYTKIAKTMEVQGYLEAGGFITKVSSIEDIKNFIARCGRSVNEITEAELDQATNFPTSGYGFLYDYMDDCSVYYKTNPMICLNGKEVILNHMNSYKILDGTVAINKFAFTETENKDRLQNIYMPDTVITIGAYAFWNRKMLCCIKLTTSLLKIGDSAFYGCSSLKSISNLPNLKYIGSHAFEQSGLETITIPTNTIKIGSCAFRNCQALKDITFEGVPATIGSDIFDGCISLRNINVTHGSLDYFVKALHPLNKEIIKEI